MQLELTLNFPQGRGYCAGFRAKFYGDYHLPPEWQATLNPSGPALRQVIKQKANAKDPKGSYFQIQILLLVSGFQILGMNS